MRSTFPRLAAHHSPVANVSNGVENLPVVVQAGTPRPAQEQTASRPVSFPFRRRWTSSGGISWRSTLGVQPQFVEIAIDRSRHGLSTMWTWKRLIRRDPFSARYAVGDRPATTQTLHLSRTGTG